MINAKTLSLAGILLIGLSQGCTMVQTYPIAARAGDTITIAPGSLDGASPTNLTVQYYPSSNPTVPIDLTPNIRSVFNITPDRTSAAWTSSFADFIPNGSGHGPWQTVVAVDLPSTGLPEGPGNLRVSLGAGVTAPSTAHTPEGVDIALTILTGTGTKNLFKYMPYPWATSVVNGNISQLMPGYQFVIKPLIGSNGSFTGENYAAAEFTLHMPMRTMPGGSPVTLLYDHLRVVLDPNPALDAYQVGLSWRRDGDNIIVNILSPEEKISFRQVRFSVVISDDASFGFSESASIVGVKYFDITGNVVSTTPIHTLQDMTI